jgi:hypothetical protein
MTLTQLYAQDQPLESAIPMAIIRQPHRVFWLKNLACTPAPLHAPRRTELLTGVSPDASTTALRPPVVEPQSVIARARSAPRRRRAPATEGATASRDACPAAPGPRPRRLDVARSGAIADRRRGRRTAWFPADRFLHRLGGNARWAEALLGLTLDRAALGVIAPTIPWAAALIEARSSDPA